MPQKTVNRFLFVRFRRCKNSSPAFPLAYKSTAAVSSALQKDQTATASLTRCKAHAAAFVSVVSAGCLVHFLTLVSNLIVSQITSIARNSFPLFPCAWIQLAAFVSVVSSSLLVSGGKVITFLPNKQIFLEKSFVKNSYAINYAAFRYTLAVGAFAAINASIILFIRVYVRVRACVCMCVEA